MARCFLVLDVAEYSRWLKTAKSTLKSAEGDLERGDYSWACFKAQQAAEFAVKALLYGLGLPAHGHSISGLLAKAPSSLHVSEGLIQRAKTLDKLYIPTRYPNAWAEGSPEDYYTVKDAEEAICCAKEVVSWVEASWRSLRKEGG